jgi:hypothetical protein
MVHVKCILKGKEAHHECFAKTHNNTETQIMSNMAKKEKQLVLVTAVHYQELTRRVIYQVIAKIIFTCELASITKGNHKID